jgi:hypothetical protein
VVPRERAAFQATAVAARAAIAAVSIAALQRDVHDREIKNDHERRDENES